MPYTTTTRNPRLRVQHTDIGRITHLIGSQTPITLYDSSGNSIPLGSQTTTSWRTKPPGEQPASWTNVIRGDDMYRAIRRGYDFSVRSGSSGTLNDLVDKGITPYDKGHEFYSALTYSHKEANETSLDPHNNDMGALKCPGAILPRDRKTTTVKFSQAVKLPGNSYYTRFEYWGQGPSLWYPTGVAKVPDLLEYPTDSQIIQDGTACIRRASPVSPQANTVQTLCELAREGFPLLGKATVSAAKGNSYGALVQAPAKEHLAATFGVKPIVGYLDDLMDTVKKSHQLLVQLRRDSGKAVRRSYGLIDDVTTTKIADVPYSSFSNRSWAEGTSNWNVLPFVNVDNVRCVTTDILTRKVWFSGQFVYHINVGDSLLDKFERFSQEADRLYGLAFDPSDAWALTPWSWLTDWAWNVGDILSNASAQLAYGQVLRYGYVMHHYAKRRTHLISGLRKANLTPLAPFLSGDTSIVRKKRTRSTPFGFGVNLPSLSNGQWAILGSLGLTRGPGILRLDE